MLCNSEKIFSCGRLKTSVRLAYLLQSEFQRIIQTMKMVNKHYQIPLPFRNAKIQLPNNKYQA